MRSWLSCHSLVATRQTSIPSWLHVCTDFIYLPRNWQIKWLYIAFENEMILEECNPQQTLFLVVKWSLEGRARVLKNSSKVETKAKCRLLESLIRKVLKQISATATKLQKISSVTHRHQQTLRRTLSNSVKKRRCKSSRQPSRKRPRRGSSPTHGIHW